MRNQEQAFRVYYGSMTDAELLRIAANESSFIAVAQRILDSELAKRHLTPPRPAPLLRQSLFAGWRDHLAKWARHFHHHPASP